MNRYISLVFMAVFIISGCSTKQNASDDALSSKNTGGGASIADEQNQDDEKGEDSEDMSENEDGDDEDSEDVLSDEEKDRLNDEMKPYEENSKSSSQNKSDDELMTEAMKTKNKELCSQISSEDLKKTCVNNIEDMT